MEAEGTSGTLRRAANVVGAVLQVLVGAGGMTLLGLDVGRVSDQNATLVVPAGYAFVIWSPIFTLCLAYAVFQALPDNHGKPLLRRVGWFTAGTFWLNAVWEVLFPSGWFGLAEIVIVGGFACAGTAYARMVRTANGRALDAAERWLVALPLGLLAGWLTAAVFVSVATTGVALGLLSGGAGEALLGAQLLLLLGVVASVMIGYGRAVPAGFLPYATAVLWGLAAVVVNQYSNSLLTTVAALVSFVLVAAITGQTLRGGWPHARRESAPLPQAST